MRRRLLSLLAALAATTALSAGCSSAATSNGFSPGGGGGATGKPDSGLLCGTCFGSTYTPCGPDGAPGASVTCAGACAVGLGCVDCVPGMGVCVGNEVHACASNGTVGDVTETCDVGSGESCSEGVCKDACAASADLPSNAGCEFWAVDLDQVDAFNDPASMPFGVVISNAGLGVANVTIEVNDAAPGDPLATTAVQQLSVAPGDLAKVELGSRELDCGARANDYAAPGTCVSSRAFRITSSSPILVYQFNVFVNAFSNDASLLLPTTSLGRVYRAVGWGAGHPVALGLPIIDRSYVTVVGTKPGTHVHVKPTFRIRGNPPIPTTNAGDPIDVVLGPFDVLNLETDDATFAEATAAQNASLEVADLTGTTVEADQPVAVFSGSESTGVPGALAIATPPSWNSESCCLDHLEDQMLPLESLGRRFLVTRSPIRSSGSWHEPDVLRFVGAAAATDVTTNLPAPFDHFQLQPGEIRDTSTDRDVVVEATEPLLVAQLLVSQDYVDGSYKGDPSLTLFPPVEQLRGEYVFLAPPSWGENWVVIGAKAGTSVLVDGVDPKNCIEAQAGTLAGVDYVARRCPLGSAEGVHRLLSGDPFQIVAYGYGSAGSYALVGGAQVKKIYDPPPLR